MRGGLVLEGCRTVDSIGSIWCLPTQNVIVVETTEAAPVKRARLFSLTRSGGRPWLVVLHLSTLGPPAAPRSRTSPRQSPGAVDGGDAHDSGAPDRASTATPTRTATPTGPGARLWGRGGEGRGGGGSSGGRPPTPTYCSAAPPTPTQRPPQAGAGSNTNAVRGQASLRHPTMCRPTSSQARCGIATTKTSRSVLGRTSRRQARAAPPRTGGGSRRDAPASTAWTRSCDVCSPPHAQLT